jgi:hypothetical protein
VGWRGSPETRYEVGEHDAQNCRSDPQGNDRAEGVKRDALSAAKDERLVGRWVRIKHDPVKRGLADAIINVEKRIEDEEWTAAER